MTRSGITRILGQHMLVDRRILNKIVSAASVSEDEIVLEMGTGQGVLTAELSKHAKQVISYEVDVNLLRKVKLDLFSQFNNVQLIRGDLLKTKNQPFFDVFVSNLPYSRSRDTIEWLSQQKFDRAIVMVQEEFADKLDARPGSRNYRSVSALAAHCFGIQRLFKVRRESFEPTPRVESLLIKITPLNTITSKVIRNINLIFSRRNKKATSVAAELGIIVDEVDYGSKKVDELKPKDIVRMAELMASADVYSV
ncbi:MAG: 16S rRNA (adenine(1518)-N(6)/adenine(1519)-N(6))-dimethyltransferase RsmA [Nitrososphaera sp.]